MPEFLADALMLSRIQFALNISFHILFPSITIALCWLLLFFKVRWHLSGDAVWLRIYRFWVKIFALTFALGVVTGITMSFQFGTNWPGYMEKVGNIAGPLLGYEVLTAFFLEATFLGIMLFGTNRVSPRVHTLATLVVALGTSASAFWIIALNSWMQTPVGFEIRDGIVFPVDWWLVIFNPSMPYRLAHVLLASGLTAAFLVSGLSAYRLLRGDNKRAPLLSLKVGLTLAAILVPLQIYVGDLHGLNTLEHQAAKVAAMEGVWHTEKGVPLLLFAIPDESEKRNHLELAIPNLASLILTHKVDGEIRGLNEFGDDHPPVAAVFWAFRVMVGLGMLMLCLGLVGSVVVRRKAPLPRWLLRACMAMTFSGWLATLAGWYVTEIGRQPYLVTGILKTSEAVTSLPGSNVALSLGLYLALYIFLFWAYLRTLFLMCRRSVEIEEIDQNEHAPHFSNSVTT